ncbi:hypothetical protein [Paracoccus ravus]|uniref:hypothetical protein n=1 Tax=Paracoccus ravus TaxID=2447760 RepID=UPI00106E0DAC|nr:hypothetical protein [Paracoccus ravus]
MNLTDILHGFILMTGMGVLILFILISIRLRKLNNLESGLGGAIAVMASEIDRLDSSIRSVKTEALRASSDLSAEIERAKYERKFWALQADVAQPATHRKRLRCKKASNETRVG